MPNNQIGVFMLRAHDINFFLKNKIDGLEYLISIPILSELPKVTNENRCDAKKFLQNCRLISQFPEGVKLEPKLIGGMNDPNNNNYDEKKANQKPNINNNDTLIHFDFTKNGKIF
ncbi:MAG: hypothetical protein KDD61_17405 [Bdellovibrionales bacterium]|nr:hypothetical protein [Bdellovibrionales bacterium]